MDNFIFLYYNESAFEGKRGQGEFMKKRKMTPYLLVLVSFATIILLGSFLLSMPWSYKNGSFANYWDALLLSTSAVCVTGLTPYANLSQTLSLFGQIVLILLVQIGGLGFITLFTFFLSALGVKIGAMDRFVLKEALSLENFASVLKFVKKVVLYTFVVEGIGILLYLFIFIPKYGVSDGIWISIFHSISSFNNAGFDIVGDNSLISYAGHIPLNIITMLLIVIGGIGFPVIDDVIHHKPKKWSCYTKIVLLSTSILIVFGTAALWLAEYRNGMTFLQALFQSVSCRTAGFATYDMNLLSDPGRLICEFLMFVGASPLSTGGGIKTTTFFTIILAIFSYMHGKKPVVFQRTISQNSITRAMALIFVACAVIIMGYLGIEIIESSHGVNHASGKIFFEVFSALNTVGYTQSLTPNLLNGSKVILSLLMFLGRVGPITVLSVFSNALNNEREGHVRYIEENLVIG